MHTRDVALPTAMNVAAAPTITATDAPKNAGWGITPIWNPMIVLAIFYAVLFLIFVAAVAFIFVRRRRRARADAAHLTTTTTTYAGQDPEKGGEARGSISGESDVGSEDPNKTVTIAHAGAGECKGSPASDGTTGTGTGTGAGSKRYYTCDGPSEVWATPPPLPRSVRFSSRTWTQMSLPSHANLSDLSVAQRETSQVLVWLPSFNIQRNAGGDAGAGAARVGEGERCSERAPVKEQEQGRGQEGSAQEREEVPAKEVCPRSCARCDAFLHSLTCGFRTQTPSMAWHSSEVDFSLVLLGRGLGVSCRDQGTFGLGESIRYAVPSTAANLPLDVSAPLVATSD